MQSRCLLQVVFILCAVNHVIGSGLCVRTSPADEGQTRVTFLREEVDGARALYLSLWSEDRPVTCEVNSDPLVTEGYRHVCTRSQDTSQRFNISELLAPDSPCVNVSSAQKFGTRTRRDGKVRRKRSWIFPGTLWCGTGSRAAGYDQLGMFESADRCCREHDHCLHIIQSFTVNYGVFNSNFFTVSHCDCDQRFRECLLGVNDTISSMVGYSFFNLLQVPCFELRLQRRCTEAYWWGTCKVKQNAPIAVFHKPLPYSNAPSNNDSNMLTTTERQHTTGNVDRKSPRGEHRCRSRGDALYLRRAKLRGCKTHRKVSPVSRVDTTTPPITARPLNASALGPNGARAGNSSLLDHPTPRSEVSPQVMTNSYPVVTTTTQSTPSLTQPTVVMAVTRRHRKIPKQSNCCGLRMPLRGDTFQPRCKSCPEGNTTSDMATVTHGSPARNPGLIETTESHAAASVTHLKPAASSHQDGELQQQMDFPLPENRTSREPEGNTGVHSAHAGRGLEPNLTLHNLTDKQLLCGSLKHLDECKHRIRPLEKKYNLQNTESKTSYHCDCTSRLAIGMQSVKPSSVVPELLIDFVSQFCFKLPKETKCNRGESCSGGFSKASDLLEALKMTERKDAAGVQHSARRRGIPTRLYKRCLRLEREADVMARLTRS